MVRQINSQILFLVVALLVLSIAVNAEVPKSFNYQGRLTDDGGNPVPDDSYEVVFTIYDAATGGNSKWTETQSIITSNGLFAVLLGTINPIVDTVFNGTTRYLSLEVAGAPELSPRTAMVSVPYAQRVSTIDGASGGDVVGDMVLSGKATFGPSNTNTGTNSFVFGKSNIASGDNATISGGWLNTASGPFQSTVGGGAQNTSSHSGATVGGGTTNTASSTYSTVGGGFYNIASGNSATVSGGYQSVASGDYSYTAGYADTISASGDYSVLFGIGSKLTQDSTFMVDMPHVRIGNEADGFEFPTADGTSGQVMTTNGSGQVSWSTLETGGGGNWTESGGVLFTTGVYGIARLSNTVYGINNDTTHINLGVNSTTGEFGFDYKYITISGGYQNIASGDLSTIAGGANNSASDSATVSGGYNNTASGNLATVGGGRTNLANGARATISGGSNNHASGNLPTIGGGYGNYAVDSAAVGGGSNNNANGVGATIGGGSLNEASGLYATVGGGLIDTASGDNATVAGGWNNMASNTYATVSGGNFNNAGGQSSTIGGGMDNVVVGNSGTISGGGSNSISDGSYATIGGGYNNDANGYGSTVGGGLTNRALDEYATVSGGFDNVADSTYATVGGGLDNLVVANYATISGGTHNVVNGAGAFIGGGWSNLAGGEYASIGGGQQNDASIQYSTIGGGVNNTANGSGSTVCGGGGNTASLTDAIVCGGSGNTANGICATVCGGASNVAEEAYTFAAGHNAKALHNGSFVWSDNPAGELEVVSSSANNQFVVRATGGVRFYSDKGMTSGVTLDPGGGSWVSVSDSTLKENIQPVDGNEILEKLSELKVSRWNYKTQDESIQHIGPMAQDFHRLFGVGNNNTTITTVDPDGIALAAIKALIDKNETLESEIMELKKLVEDLIANQN